MMRNNHYLSIKGGKIIIPKIKEEKKSSVFPFSFESSPLQQGFQFQCEEQQFLMGMSYPFLYAPSVFSFPIMKGYGFWTSMEIYCIVSLRPFFNTLTLT